MTDANFTSVIIVIPSVFLVRKLMSGLSKNNLLLFRMA